MSQIDADGKIEMKTRTSDERRMGGTGKEPKANREKPFSALTPPSIFPSA
jgi:hypothetical protein